MKKRVFIAVLDSLGIGELPDAAQFSDSGSNTLRSLSHSRRFSAPNLIRAGLGNIHGVEGVEKSPAPTAAYGRMAEKSMGKDTTIGHWELAGVISPNPLPTYPDGFPDSLIRAFEEKTGKGVLCNQPFSGTEVIRLFGRKHLESGDLIVYTSADSVFQIAAHEDVVPLEELYRYCRIARDLLQGEHGVGRVIARPFVGSPETGFTRTPNRRDFSLLPPSRTLLDAASEAGYRVISIGKIYDIFAGRGITETHKTKGNAEGMKTLLSVADCDFNGICFLNLVDFDSLYGHRNDVDGYAAALEEFDSFLPSFLRKMQRGDLLIVTADHGCDPGTPSTDHSREYVPLLIFGEGIAPISLGTRASFTDLAKTLAEYLGLREHFPGQSFLKELLGDEKRSVTP